MPSLLGIIPPGQGDHDDYYEYSLSFHQQLKSKLPSLCRPPCVLSTPSLSTGRWPPRARVPLDAATAFLRFRSRTKWRDRSCIRWRSVLSSR
ncbi:hypothetical protein PC112_g8640 [Phytophthora cactorum]|nr:hypothetical protein PC112_g8640 [Phytophthora cactorum]KAG3022099.1 hypothetical protein PC120_g8319 [Phytophthora cactorum]